MSNSEKPRPLGRGDVTSTPSRFEEKAREIINWNIHEAREDLTALSSAISSALEAAYQEGRKDGEEYGENSVWLWLDDNTVSVQNQIANSMMARFKREKLSEAAMNELVKIGQEIDKEPNDV